MRRPFTPWQIRWDAQFVADKMDELNGPEWWEEQDAEKMRGLRTGIPYVDALLASFADIVDERQAKYVRDTTRKIFEDVVESRSAKQGTES